MIYLTIQCHPEEEGLHLKTCSGFRECFLHHCHLWLVLFTALKLHMNQLFCANVNYSSAIRPGLFCVYLLHNMLSLIRCVFYCMSQTVLACQAKCRPINTSYILEASRYLMSHFHPEKEKHIKKLPLLTSQFSRVLLRPVESESCES